MDNSWEAEIAGFLRELLDVQDSSLAVLARKREALAAVDTAALAELATVEGEVVARLESCLKRRNELLARARGEGLPADSLRGLSSALSARGSRMPDGPLEQASSRGRLLAHQGLVNWVIVQRTLLHLSQLLEIIATGGRARPTYCKEDAQRLGGGLVNQVA